jgi:hypothetical protein
MELSNLARKLASEDCDLAFLFILFDWFRERKNSFYFRVLNNKA